jgi:hypothetical protein
MITVVVLGVMHKGAYEVHLQGSCAKIRKGCD